MFKQKVNFYVSIGLITVFGFLMTITVVHAIDSHAAVFEHISSPIDIDPQ